MNIDSTTIALLRMASDRFDDIEDDARILLSHAPENLHAMILGIQIVARQEGVR